MTPEQADAILELHSALVSVCDPTRSRSGDHVVVPTPALLRLERAYLQAGRLAVFHDALQVMRDNIPRIGAANDRDFEASIRSLRGGHSSRPLCRHCGGTGVIQGRACQECPRGSM